MDPPLAVVGPGAIGAIVAAALHEVVQRLGRAYGIPTPVSDLVVPLLAASSSGPG